MNQSLICAVPLISAVVIAGLYSSIILNSDQMPAFCSATCCRGLAVCPCGPTFVLKVLMHVCLADAEVGLVQLSQAQLGLSSIGSS